LFVGRCFCISITHQNEKKNDSRYWTTGTPYPANLLTQESEYLEEDESELAGLIGSGSGSKSGSGNGSGRGAFDGSGSKKQQRLNEVYQFYTRYPDASLADGIKSLGISGAALSRFHAELVQAGNLEPFPKNR
jgi:hypothetical protein